VKKHFSHIIFSILLMSWAIPSFAQMRHHVDAQSEFSRRLDAMQWRMYGNYDLDWLRTRVTFRNQFSSRLYLIRGNAENIQDEYRSRLDATQYGPNSLGFGIIADAYGFSAANVRQERLMAGPAFRFKDNGLQFRPMVGFMSDTRNDRQDSGPGFGLTGDWPNLVIGDFRFNPVLMLEYASISPREHGSYRLGSDALYRDENIKLSGMVQLGRSLRDSYQASNFLNRDVTDLIESIRSDTALVQAAMEFPLGKGSIGRIELYTMGNNRQFTNKLLSDTVRTDIVDTRFGRQDYDLVFQAFVPKGQVVMNPGIRFLGTSATSQLINTENLSSDQVVRRGEILERSNFRQSAIELFADNRFQPSADSEIGLRFILGILRYNTPTINVDDRDEQTFAVRLTARHRFSQWFDAGVTMAGEAYHNVYLFGERSVENNWRRSIRLLPELNWRPSDNVLIRNAMFIRANYTAYDFQVPGRLNADQSAREYGFRTRVEYQFLPQWFIETEGSRSELRIGRLQWGAFTETPIDTLVTYEMETTISKRIGNTKIATGFRAFRKVDFMPQAITTIVITDPETGNRSFSRIAPGFMVTNQLGPVVQVMLPLSNQNELYVDGWFQRQRTNTSLYTEYPEEFREAFLAREKRAMRIMYPNLTLRARFKF
jgi:hypothetical protein